MLIAYTPQDGSAAVTAIVLGAGSGTGQDWLTSDDGAACFDGKPARKARFLWRNDASPTTAHYVQVVATLAALTPVRVIALLGLANVPAGVSVEVYGKRAGDAGASWNFGGQNTGTVVQFADGTFGCWIVLPDGAEAVTQIAYRLLNDNGGSTWATAATQVDVGELVGLPAVEVPIDAGWTQVLLDPSVRSDTRGSQVNIDSRAPYRVLASTFSPSGSGEAPVRFGGLANGMDWERLATAVAGGGRCAVIPRWASTARIQATAQYGIAAEIGATEHIRGPFWRKQMTFREIPST